MIIVNGQARARVLSGFQDRTVLRQRIEDAFLASPGLEMDSSGRRFKSRRAYLAHFNRLCSTFPSQLRVIAPPPGASVADRRTALDALGGVLEDMTHAFGRRGGGR